MQLGMIGLGRMGANIVRRLMKAGHSCVVYDRDPAPGLALAAEGAPAGSMIQIARGASSPATSAPSDSTAFAPSAASARPGAGSRS
jgi:6-phosphogluconate dehydrogenase (decarboxylating)